tara:strand:+ start:316 stop:534 length:219 start_codon:yes stop_codon:yes gene_type:complete
MGNKPIASSVHSVPNTPGVNDARGISMVALFALAITHGFTHAPEDLAMSVEVDLVHSTTSWQCFIQASSMNT